MTPKYAKPSDPDRTFEIGDIKLVRIGKTIYLYTTNSVHPLMTQKFGEDHMAMYGFSILKASFNRICRKHMRRTRWQRLKEWLGFV